MRVISGIYRSRLLEEVSSDSTRETKDRVKESLSNSLQPYLYEATVLDLFAGSGSLGIEAISRGAAEVSFVDNSYHAIAVIKRNLESLKITDEAIVFQEDYKTFLHHTTQTYDVIILDPPYDLDVLDDIITMIADKKLLQPDGIIATLYGKNTVLKTENNGIIEYKKKTMGITNLSLMKWGI